MRRGRVGNRAAGCLRPCEARRVRRHVKAIVVTVLAVGASPAAALCSGASLEQEYREADLVVRALVVAETRVSDDEPSAEYKARWGDYSPVLLNRLRVLEVFKGRPGPSIKFFQEVSSGRFDLDLGREYLLFLNYHRPPPGAEARGAVYVRYSCGQSKSLSEVEPGTPLRLRALERGL
jgi:hypothetical protein